MRSLTRLFPRKWRARYGKEIADLVEDMKADERGFRFRDRLDLASAGISERGSEIWCRGAHSPRIVALRAATACVALVLVLGPALLIGGVLEGRPSPPPSRVVMSVTPARLIAVSAGSVPYVGILSVTPARLMPVSVTQVRMVPVTPTRLIRVSVGSVTRVWTLSVTAAGQVPRH
jgi:hypothetical protein